VRSGLVLALFLLGCEGRLGTGALPPRPTDAGGGGIALVDGAPPADPPPDAPRRDAGRPDDPPPDEMPDAGVPDDPPPPDDDPLGECTGTPAECEAARVVNEYRTTHMNRGECNNPLRWDANLGRLAHEHQSGPFVSHSSHGYIEVVGQAYGVRETAEYIMQWEPVIEEHCGADGSYTVSHHCATMFCNNFTIGIGVYEADATYMTIMFGDEAGRPGW
jgi:hypothetical protein